MIEPLYEPRKGEMYMLKPICEFSGEKMRVAGLISGSGLSLRAVIERQLAMEAAGNCPFEVVGVFADNPKSKALELGKAFNLPFEIVDIRAFYAKRGRKINDKQVRAEYDKEILRFLEPLKPDLLAYAGYVWATSPDLVEAYLSINAHPADLTIEKDGRRPYAGANGVKDALEAGEHELRSSLALVTNKVDYGPVLLLSDPVKVDRSHEVSLEEASRFYLRVLNEKIRKLFARAVKDIADGTFKKDDAGSLYYKDSPIPRGFRFEKENEI
jgi:folate-dependent phosphoribosylglycinamide formyltransferase PurN